LLEEQFSKLRSYTRLWSFGYNFFQFGGALMAAAAAVILKLDVFPDVNTRNNYAAILSGASAVFVTILTIGRFQRKWEANRLAAFDVQNLRWELEKHETDPDRVLEKLQTISATRNNRIVGAGN
jgi:hypothetical protein